MEKQKCQVTTVYRGMLNQDSRLGSKKMSKIKAVLFDLDGTLYFKGAAIPGADEVLKHLRGLGLAMRFLTNTDSRRAESIYQRVVSYGLDIRLEELYTPVLAAVQFVERVPGAKVFALVSDEVQDCFGQCQPVDRVSGAGADYVVVGDFIGKVSYSLMNEAFRHLDSGAELIALQKGRYFHNEGGKNLDTGAFVAMLEFAANKEARVLGKPSPDFFMQAIVAMGLEPGEVMVVGDDVTTDIVGAKAIGAFSVLVRTGKFSDMPHFQSRLPGMEPDLVLDSVADLLYYF